eukprot:COSAG05_NODE_1843_length_3978_cov_2.302913_4_plen_817_part_01
MLPAVRLLLAACPSFVAVATAAEQQSFCSGLSCDDPNNSGSEVSCSDFSYATPQTCATAPCDCTWVDGPKDAYLPWILWCLALLLCCFFFGVMSCVAHWTRSRTRLQALSSQQEGTDIICGINATTVDDVAANNIKLTIAASAVILALSLLQSIEQAIVTNNAIYLVLVPLGFALPSCGYCGAKERNRCVLGTFWVLCTIIAMLTIVDIIILVEAFNVALANQPSGELQNALWSTFVLSITFQVLIFFSAAVGALNGYLVWNNPSFMGGRIAYTPISTISPTKEFDDAEYAATVAHTQQQRQQRNSFPQQSLPSQPTMGAWMELDSSTQTPWASDTNVATKLGGCYRVLRATRVRTRCDLNSNEVFPGLQGGDVIRVLEMRHLLWTQERAYGQLGLEGSHPLLLRLRFERGWASVTTQPENVSLLEPIPTYNVTFTRPPGTPTGFGVRYVHVVNNGYGIDLPTPQPEPGQDIRLLEEFWRCQDETLLHELNISTKIGWQYTEEHGQPARALVSSVVAGSEAEAAGVMVGLEVTHINDKPTAGLDITSVKKLMSEAISRRPTTMTLAQFNLLDDEESDDDHSTEYCSTSDSYTSGSETEESLSELDNATQPGAPYPRRSGSIPNTHQSTAAAEERTSQPKPLHLVVTTVPTDYSQPNSLDTVTRRRKSIPVSVDQHNAHMVLHISRCATAASSIEGLDQHLQEHAAQLRVSAQAATPVSNNHPTTVPSEAATTISSPAASEEVVTGSSNKQKATMAVPQHLFQIATTTVAAQQAEIEELRQNIFSLEAQATTPQSTAPDGSLSCSAQVVAFLEGAKIG